MQMITKALYGRLPLKLPATLETIIDGSVKKFIDLIPVKEWTQRGALAIVDQGKPIPACLVERLLPLLSKHDQSRIVLSTHHWLDELMNGLAAHQQQYIIALDKVANQARPPVELFRSIDPAWKPFGKQLRGMYADVLRSEGNQHQARIVCQAFLDKMPANARTTVLLAASAYCYTLGKQDDSAPFSDNCVWQLGEKDATGKRVPGIAQLFISALRQIGLIGEPVWTTSGAVLAYNTEHTYPAPLGVNSGIPVTFNGTWFNWLKSVRRAGMLVSPEIPTSMGLIPKEVRQQAKEVIAKLTDSKFIGMELIIERRGERFIARTAQGNLFGFIEKGHEKRVARHPAWQVEWATATDGNVHAILRPAKAQVGQLALPLPQGAVGTTSMPRLCATGASRSLGITQLKLPFAEGAAPKPEPVQLELFAKAA